MMIVIPIPAIGAGLLAAALVYAVAQGWLFGVTAPMLPLFTLALAGMVYGRPGITVASVAASLALLVLLPVYDALLMAMTQIIPLMLFIRQIMVVTRHASASPFVWTSTGDAMAIIALYGALFYALIIATGSGLYHHVSERMAAQMGEVFATLEPEVAVALESAVTQMPHVILAMEYWFIAILLVLLTLLAQMVAETLSMGRRPSLRLSDDSPPNLVLGALGLAGILGFTGVEALVHAGHAAGLILLLPYFFSGLGMAHRTIRRWQGGTFWLAVFYLLMLLTGWPLLLITVLGLLRHLSRYTLSSSTR